MISKNWKKKKKKKKIYSRHDPAIENGQAHHWSLKIKIYMIYFRKHSSQLIHALRKINLKLQIFGLLAMNRIAFFVGIKV